MQAGESIAVVNQYLVDLSFENPAAQFARIPAGQPEITKNINVAGGLRPDGRYNVDVRFLVTVSADGQPMFLVEATYRGVCDVGGAPISEALKRRLLVEGGGHLFPAIRDLVSHLSAQGGYTPTLVLDPIDFEAVYEGSMLTLADASPN